MSVRILGGELRNRILHTAAGRKVRPSSGLLRKVIFDLIGPGVRDAAVLDLYAGPGTLGIEALSRGAASCVFVERDRENLELLQRNLREMNLNARAKVVRADVAAFCRNETGVFQGILVDPPYSDWAQLRGLGLERLLSPHSWLVLQMPSHSPDDPLVLAGRKRRTKTHGISKIVIYE